MKRILSLIIALILLMTPVLASADSVVDYTADFYVADYANVLDDEVEGLIVLNNDVLDKACGAQIVVVTVDTVGGMTMENYAYTLFNEWGIGAKGKNNGLLILLSIGDGAYWLMPGKGLQDYLTAGDLDEMAAELLVPPALEGDYSTGVRQLFSACFEKVSLAYDAGVTLDETLYYTWLQSGSSSTGGAKYLSEPVREMPVQAVPAQPVQATEVPAAQNHPNDDDEGGFSFLTLIIILIVLLVVFGGAGRVVRTRPGRPVPPPRRPVAPPPPPRPPMGGFGGPAPRPPMGGFGGPAPRPSPRPAPRPAPRPSSGFGGSRTGGGGMSRGGGVGGSFGGSRPASRPVSRPVSRPASRPSGFGGGRTGGGGTTRGGGAGGSFGGRR